MSKNIVFHTGTGSVNTLVLLSPFSEFFFSKVNVVSGGTNRTGTLLKCVLVAVRGEGEGVGGDLGSDFVVHTDFGVPAGFIDVDDAAEGVVLVVNGIHGEGVPKLACTHPGVDGCATLGDSVVGADQREVLKLVLRVGELIDHGLRAGRVGALRLELILGGAHVHVVHVVVDDLLCPHRLCSCHVVEGADRRRPVQRRETELSLPCGLVGPGWHRQCQNREEDVHHGVCVVVGLWGRCDGAVGARMEIIKFDKKWE